MMRSFFVTVAAFATCAAPAAAQDSRVFANINFGYQAAPNQDFRQTAEFPLYDETGNWQADHALESGPMFDVGAGFRVTRSLSLGVAYSVRTKQDRDVTVTANVPHPIFFDSFRTATGTVTGLEHSEQAVHLQAIWHVPVTVEFGIALFGGPTFFRVEDTLVESVTPVETGDLSTVDLQFGRSSQSQSAVGFNVGVDSSYMLTRNAGIGAMLRYTRGSVDLLNPAGSGGDISIDTGGLEIGAGLRFRF